MHAPHQDYLTYQSLNKPSLSKMDSITIVISLILAFAFFKTLFLFSNRGKKLPPGPFQLPIIGNLPRIGKLPHQSLAQLAQIYGPIMHLKLGSITTIVISSSIIAQEVLQKQDLAFSSRFTQDALRACDHSKYSLIWLPIGPRWKNLRKIVTTNIFSVNKLNANQHLRSRKMNELIGFVEKCSQTGEAIDIGRAAFRTSLNLLSSTVFSKDMANPYEDSAKEFKDLVRGIMYEIGKPNLSDFFPVLKKLDLQGVKRRITRHFIDLLKILEDLISERLELKRSGISVENTDALDELIKVCQENPEYEIDTNQMAHLFVDLFAAGIDTSSSTLEWCMAEVMKSTETMVKAKAELSQVLGQGKMLEEADIPQLPYLQCIVKETLRLHPPVPLLLPRQINKEAKVNGYTFPKNSQVIINAWAVGRDPVSWINPLSFHPERFLDSEIDVKGQDFELIPFGAGRRMCPGLPLVVRMVPVMLGSLLNCFDWELEDGIKPNELNMAEKFGITVEKLYPLRAIATSVSGHVI